MRWGLTRKKQVGAVAEQIRLCQPKNLQEWEHYYYNNVYPKEHLTDLGKKLYTKVTEVVKAEINDINEQNCIDFIINLVINRTYDGYTSEKETIYEQLQEILNEEIKPASDEWDRKYNVDFYIKIKDKFIGLQIKPVGYEYITQIINEHNQQLSTHKKFKETFGGDVFYVYSVKKEKKKEIANPEIIREIRAEIKRLNEE